MRRLAAALVLVPLLGACSSPASPAALAVAEVGLAGAPVQLAGEPAPVAPLPEDPPTGEPVEPVVEAGPEHDELPPGDPGVDAPEVPEPPPAEAHAHGDEELPGRVPPGALLTAADLGPGWSTTDAAASPCAPRESGPQASTVLVAPDGSRLAQTVAVAADGPAAVAEWRRALAGCGLAVTPLALGDAGASAHGAGARVLVTTAEQVLVVLRATGPLAADPGLPDLGDVALGTSCPAAPDGCH